MQQKSEEIQTLISKSVELIIKSKHMIAFTGAGISTPSGIPDFRSPDSGLWNQYDPYEVASLNSFLNHPERFFNWIQPLAIKSESAQPNKAHLGLASMEKAGLLNAIITQNIDGLHQKAGSKNVLELHGSTKTATCPHCGKIFNEESFKESFIKNKEIPYCNSCRKVIKPDVVLYGEPLPEKAWKLAYDECMKTDLMIIVGSSLEVTPANSLPELVIAQGAQIIINNLSPTYLNKVASITLELDVEYAIGNIWELIDTLIN